MARRVVSISGSATTTNHYPLNRIITRGMGPSTGAAGRAGMVTQGYGGVPPAFVTEAFQSVVVGQSGTKRKLQQLDEVIIWAKMIEINGKAAPEIKGWIKVKVDKNRAAVMAEHLASRTRAAWEFIKVSARRLK